MKTVFNHIIIRKLTKLYYKITVELFFGVHELNCALVADLHVCRHSDAYELIIDGNDCIKTVVENTP